MSTKKIVIAISVFGIVTAFTNLNSKNLQNEKISFGIAKGYFTQEEFSENLAIISVETGEKNDINSTLRWFFNSNKNLSDDWK